MSAPILELIDASRRQGDFLLREVSLCLASGEVLAVLGPNGAGKSTLLTLAAGLAAPDSGEVRLLDAPIQRQSRRELARVLGYLPQSPGLPPGLSVAQVAALGRYARLSGLGFLSAQDQEVVERVLEAAELSELAERPAEQLSGGERQRLLLASVLAQEPRVLVLDEPERGLDPGHQARLFGLFRESAARGLGVLLSTHDLNLAAAYADRAILLDHGQVLRQGSMDEILDQALLDAVYGAALRLTSHPATGRPAVLPHAGGAL